MADNKLIQARTRACPDSRSVIWWHGLLGAIAVLNLTLWTLSAAAVIRGRAAMPSGMYVACQLQLLLSALYVLGCAFRSALPVYDIPRIVLIDSRLSSVMLGRAVATIAELCFAAQWALVLHRIGLLSHSRFANAVSWAIVPFVMLAEIASWHAVLTTRQRGHILENSIWGLSAALMVVSLLVVGLKRFEFLSPLMLAWTIGGAACAAYLFCFDVPMYWRRWHADRIQGRRYLSIAQGMVDTRERRVVSCRWQDWKDEMLWMTLYFSVGVWSSISLVFASISLGPQGN